MNNYIIYDHISPSGKHYIGQTCQKPERRWGANGKSYLILKEDGKYKHPALAPAIEKYGWDNFEHKILFSGLNKIEADMIEEDLIYYYKKIGLSYNISNGGEGSPKSEEVKKKMSYAHKGIPCSDSAKRKLSEIRKGKLNSGRSKPIVQLDHNLFVVREWPSAAEANRALGIDNSQIVACCKGKHKTAGGFVWQYKENS